MALPAKKKKTDYAALGSPFMRIPRMDVRAARALIDLKFKEVFELRGRAPESLLEDLRKIKLSEPDGDLLKYFKIAVDFAEKGE